jgi:hypothetical protein
MSAWAEALIHKIPVTTSLALHDLARAYQQGLLHARQSPTASTAPSSTIANHDVTSPSPQPVGEPVAASGVHETQKKRTIMSDLSEKTTVVVGASRGLGRGIAGAFAQAGAAVVAVARTAPALPSS